MSTLGTVFEDLYGSWQGCTSSGGTDIGVFSRDFERKNLRPRKFFENFGPKSTANRMQSHAPQHVDARHSVRGPLKIVPRTHVVGQHGFWRVLARLRTQKFAAAKFSIRNLLQSHAPQHVDARHSVRGHLRIVPRMHVVGQHGFWRVLARLRTQKFAAAKFFRKFRSESR